MCVCVCSVSNISAVVEGSSESDDEDKLHIAEEEGSLQDGDSVAHDDDPNGTVDPEDRWDEGKPNVIADFYWSRGERGNWYWIG